MAFRSNEISLPIKQFPGNRRRKISYALIVTSAVLVGLTLLVSGTGKVPGQTEFIWALLKSFWTPAVAYFIGYVLPWVEIVLGILLVFGIFPRISAAMVIPLAGGFMANNIWALTRGFKEFPHCASCFGIWEEFLGSLSVLGALIIDIVLICLALVILVLYRGDFLDFRPWFIKRRNKHDSSALQSSLP